MIRIAVIPWLLSLAGLTAADRPDLLRFTNGDQLHGSFLGIKAGPQAVWRHDDLAAPVEFKTSRIRHVVLNGGRPLKPLGSLSNLELINGDRLPGKITAIDGSHITLDTPYAGILRLPRNQVSMMAPNPLGGRVHYYGPFTEDGWKMIHPSFPDGLPPAAAKNPDKPDATAEDQPGRWVFSGAAWYWQHKRGGTAIIRESGMPDRAVLSFDLAWKNRLGIAIGFHADFARPKAKKEDDKPPGKLHEFIPGDTSSLPNLFGNSYVLQMYSNYLMLFRTAVSKDGEPSIERVQLNHNNLRLGESGHAKVEIRSNRGSGAISLFIDDGFIAQWNDGDPASSNATTFAGKGQGFGFVVQADDSPVRISDIVVSEWNGMPDSARSLQADDQDVVLMANGTDRFAGRVGTLDDQGKIHFESKHGPFEFPVEDVAEIRFARERLAEAPETPADNLVDPPQSPRGHLRTSGFRRRRDPRHPQPDRRRAAVIHRCRRDAGFQFLQPNHQ